MDNNSLSTRELVAMIEEIESKYGVCDMVLNLDNLIEHIVVIENSMGNLLSIGGDKYKVHPNVALGKTLASEEYYNLKRIRYDNAQKNK